MATATDTNEPQTVRATGSTFCVDCGIPWQGMLCTNCCRKRKPEGPPLKRLRRYGFPVSRWMRACLRVAAQVNGAFPTECDPESHEIKVSHLFVACNGKTYIGHEWITQGGSTHSWSESYPSNKD